VTDGLLVTAAAIDHTSLPRIAMPCRAQGFIFRTLPGIRDPHFDSEAPSFWANPPVHRNFQIRIVDTLDRYLPLSFQTVAPQTGWLASLAPGESRWAPPNALPLFRNCPRHQDSRAFGIRATLWDPDVDRPAAWALMEVQFATPYGSVASRGLSNVDGKIFVPLAQPDSFSEPSYVPFDFIKIPSDRWEIDIKVRYSRLAFDAIPPDLGSILSQPEIVFMDGLSPQSRATCTPFPVSCDAVLRSSDDSHARLLVSAL